MTLSMHNWYGPLDHYYRSEKTPIAYSAPEVSANDLVLEISIGNYEYSDGNLLLALRTKLVDPSNGAVLAKAASVSFKNIGRPDELFSHDCQGFKTAFASVGQELLDKDLKKLGL